MTPENRLNMDSSFLFPPQSDDLRLLLLVVVLFVVFLTTSQLMKVGGQWGGRVNGGNMIIVLFQFQGVDILAFIHTTGPVIQLLIAGDTGVVMNYDHVVLAGFVGAAISSLVIIVIREFGP